MVIFYCFCFQWLHGNCATKMIHREMLQEKRRTLMEGRSPSIHSNRHVIDTVCILMLLSKGKRGPSGHRIFKVGYRCLSNDVLRGWTMDSFIRQPLGAFLERPLPLGQSINASQHIATNLGYCPNLHLYRSYHLFGKNLLNINIS